MVQVCPDDLTPGPFHKGKGSIGIKPLRFWLLREGEYRNKTRDSGCCMHLVERDKERI
jgi:hypothetical protein